MQALVINLPASTDRLQFQQEQLARLGVEYEIMRAVSSHHLHEIAHHHMGMGWERPMRKAEVACYLSHHKAWQIVLKRQQPMLILEDDALLGHSVAALLEVLERYQNCDLITLEVRGRKKLVGKKSFPLMPAYRLLPLYQDRTGAAAYVLWPSGAKILLDKAQNLPPALADAFITSTYQLRAFQVEPAAAIQLDQCPIYDITPVKRTVSSILSERRPNPIFSSSLENLRFKQRRIAAQWRMAMRHLAVLPKADRRYIKLRPADFS